jgi:uncharacterized protein
MDPRLDRILAQHPYPLLFSTISGAHLYGFPSPDSDYDLRGAHILPLEIALRIDIVDETLERGGVREGLEMDIVSHDIRKFFKLMLKKNGYVLEQLYSPLVVRTSPGHEELKAIGADCITRFHAYHYLGFAQTQWGLFEKESPRRVKPLLYVYRVLLTGIHLMRTGQVEANLLSLNADFALPYINDLVARKAQGPEKATLADADVEFHRAEYARLRTLLEDEHQRSALPDSATGRPALDELLVRLRRG